jgi:hypothetical protein
MLLLLGSSLAAASAGCSEEPSPDAVRVVKLAEFLHAEAALASWIFDASNSEDGIGTEPHEPVLRARDLADFMNLEHASCTEAAVMGDGVQVRFEGCPVAYGVGDLNGVITFLFGRVDLDGTRVLDFVLFESLGEMELGGHRMELRYYGHSIYTIGESADPFSFAYRSDVRGVAASGLTVDFTGDPDTIVDAQSCAAGECVTPQSPVFFEPASDCVELHPSEARAVVDGVSGWDVGGSYRQCGNQCPGGCYGGSPCQLSGGEALVQFDGTATTHPPDEVELDCSE